MPLNLAFSAGEASGDASAAALIKALKTMDPEIVCWGLGSQNMREAGCELLADTGAFGAIGVGQALAVTPKLLLLLNSFKKQALSPSTRPDLVILVDYGAFNVPLGRWCRKHGMKVCYYFPPGSWKRPPRISQTLLKAADFYVTPFPWHAEALQAAGKSAHWFGHPAVESDADLQPSGSVPDEITLALLPGSRRHEVHSCLPAMLKAAHLWSQQRPGLKVLISQAVTLPKKWFEDALRRAGAVPGDQPGTWRFNGLSLEVLAGKGADVLGPASIAVITSGTATLEAAILGVPHVIIYRGGRLMCLEYKLRRIKIPNIGLPNIILNERALPELLQDEASPEQIVIELNRLSQPEVQKSVGSAFANLRSLIGRSNAISNAANLILAEARQ